MWTSVLRAPMSFFQDTPQALQGRFSRTWELTGWSEDLRKLRLFMS